MDTPRKCLSLDGEWDFAYTLDAPEPSEDCFPAAEEYEVRIPVPAYWDDCKAYLKYAKFWSRGCRFNPEARKIEEFPLGGMKPPDASLPYLLGTGWYKKRFWAQEDWAEKTVTLCIGGAMLDVWVWVNGQLLKSCYSCGKPVEVKLDGSFQPGAENELLIAVSNTGRKRIGCSIRGYKGRSAGINGSVWLEISDGARIEDCYVRTNARRDRLFWEIGLRGAGSFGTSACAENGWELRWSIAEPHTGKSVGTGGCAAAGDRLKFETETFGMKPWSDGAPWLYLIRMELVSEGKCVDRLEQRFGLRFLESRGTKIYLNGNPVFLRGATDHAYFPETCTVPNDLPYYMRTVKALKEAGFNWMRFHTTVPPEECMEAADRLGMMIQAETQNGFEEQDFVNMLLLCRKHPSVILYCCGNEVPITDEFEKKLERMGELCHTMAPDCLYDPMEALLNIECRLDEKAPGYRAEPVPHDADKLARVREYSDVLATGVWVFSYHSLYADMDKINERMSIYRRPCLIHEAGIFDSFLNLDLEKRYEGTRIGADLFRAAREYAREMGVLDRTPLYYRNSCRWMKLLTKFTMEKARRCSAAAGYDFLGATDCHWHRSGYAVGVMNEFYELKAGFTGEELQQFNGESILVCDAGQERSLFAGERREVEIFSSLYGGEELEDGCLSWSLTDEQGRVRASGTVPVQRAENGALTSLGRVRVGLDEVRGAGEHLKLRARLTGGSYEVSNQWDYWIFRRPEAAETDGIRVRERLGEEDVEYMEKGGRLLLLGGGPFDSLPVSFQISPGGRVNGNCATVIYDHPIMRDFPQEGFCDWQFLPLFRDGGAVVFNELDVEFRPIVEIVSTYKMIRKQAALFEVKVGQGGMLVCALNVRSGDPAACALREAMIRYLNSGEFAPGVELGAEKLCRLMEKHGKLEADFTTDECYDTGGHIEV